MFDFKIYMDVRNLYMSNKQKNSKTSSFFHHSADIPIAEPPTYTVPKIRQISGSIGEEVPWRVNLPIILGN